MSLSHYSSTLRFEANRRAIGVALLLARVLVVVLPTVSVASLGLAQRIAPVPLPDLKTEGDDLEEFGDEEASFQAEQDRELALNLEEMRSRYYYGLAVAVGPSKPWQSYTVELQYLRYANAAFGIFAGTGNAQSDGLLDERSYDQVVRARSAGTFFRFHPMNFPRVSFDNSLGFVDWDGHATPKGSDDEQQAPEDRLSSSFRASGVYVSMAVALSWLWESGVYLEWTPLGVYKTRVLRRDFVRASAAVENAVIQNLEHAQIFGLTNLKLGYYF